MAFNLLDKLTDLDRAKIEHYIELYGTSENFIGIDAWLSYWAKNNIKLYKLLGNQMIYRVHFEYEKSHQDIISQLEELCYQYRDFTQALLDWMYENGLNDEVRYFVRRCMNPYVIAYDVITDSLKFKLSTEKKTLQIQKGAKPLRALGRFLNYCKNLDGVTEYINKFEKFRVAHSIILNDKTVKGNMCISIHPLDYMTMSDNSLNWQSCMSWTDEGCYHIGTVEMMNSNNVLCCYLESEHPYYFDEDKHPNDEEWCCSNKRWRQLVYFTKDIIVGGKSYPYANEVLSKKLIEVIRELADKNLHWHYSFGPELYQDMKWINGSYSMNRAKDYIHFNNTKKYNILFDSKGMYNDMINDSDFPYWCVRNKVKHTKVISYSGKAPCLCCGKQVIYETCDDEYYNERYGNCGAVICEDCLNKIKCDVCGDTEPRQTHIKMKTKQGETITVCSRCAKKVFRKCPDCGKTMFISYWNGTYNPIPTDKTSTEAFIKIKKATYAEYNTQIDHYSWYTRIKSKQELIDQGITKIMPICKCKDCLAKDSRFIKEKREVTGAHSWNKYTREYYISKEIENIEDWKDFFPYNLMPVDIKEGDIIEC